MSVFRDHAATLFGRYRTIFNSDVTDYASKRRRLVLPVLPAPFLIELLEVSRELFAAEPIVLEIDSSVVIVGDLHGQLLDLFRILGRFETPAVTRYLFLGDFVDRGHFSTETVTLILLLKCLWPDRVALVRGNHEFEQLFGNGLFGTELARLYGSLAVLDAFESAFSFMPLGAVIQGQALCVHGGIGPTFRALSDLREVRRPLRGFMSHVVDEALWSDPCDGVETFAVSARGAGCLFGERPLAAFLASEGLSLLIRAHQCMLRGVEWSLGGRCVTVFSASTYGNVGNNVGAVLMYDAGRTEVWVLEQLPVMARTDAAFVQVSAECGWAIVLVLRPTPSNREPHRSVSRGRLGPGLPLPSRIGVRSCALCVYRTPSPMDGGPAPVYGSTSPMRRILPHEDSPLRKRRLGPRTKTWMG